MSNSESVFRLKCKRLHPNARLPEKKHNSLCFDVFPLENFELAPKTRCKFSLGFSAEFPKEFVALVRDRSGIGSLGGLKLAGTIDSDYRGEWIIILYNSSSSYLPFYTNKAIAQILFVRGEQLKAEWVEELSETERGQSGFGSTDVK